MKPYGYAVLGWVMATMPAMAGQMPLPPGGLAGAPDANGSQPRAIMVVDDSMPVQQSALPPMADNELLASVENAGQNGRHIQSMRRVTAHQVEIRNAYEIAQGAGQLDQLAQAVDNNRQSVDQLRHSLIKNGSVSHVLARGQVPITNVVGANVEPNGNVVVYAYPQTRVPPD